MRVEILAHFEDVIEQLMIIKGYDKPSRVVEEAIGAKSRPRSIFRI